MPTVYPSRIDKHGQPKKLKPQQERAIDLMEQNAYEATLRSPRQQAHDRVCHLQAEYNAMRPLDQIDLHGLTLKAQIAGIYRAAQERGWLAE